MDRDILNDFLTAAREDTNNIVFNDANLIRIRASIDQWLVKKSSLDQQIKKRYENSLRDKDLREIVQSKGEGGLSRSGMIKLINKYINGRQKVEGILTREDINQLFRDGYELIHRVRESLVGREITYSILYSTGTKKKTGKLMEVKLTLEELLPSISLRWTNQTEAKNKQELTNAGQLFVTNSKVKQIVEKLKSNEETLEERLVEISGEKRALWDSMVETRNRMIHDETLNKYSANFGRLYEVFSLFTKKEVYEKIDTIHKPPKKNTENLFIARLNQAMRDDIPGWQAGDLGWEQLKSVFNSSAGLIGNSSIEKTLIELKEAFAKDSKKEMAQALKQIYTTQQNSFNNKIDAAAEEEAIAAIDAAIQSLNLDIK